MAPLSGFRSGRFTPRGACGTCGASAGLAPLAEVGSSSTVGSGGSPTKTVTDAEAEVAISASCGNLHACVMLAPPLPRVPSSTEAPPLPRSFFDACQQAGTPDGAPVGWPATAAPPAHLRFFCFPASLLELLCAQSEADAYGFTFSFTAQDGSVRWGCAVTGADPSAPRGALTALSVVMLCDWPVVRLMLDAAKQLLLLEQRRRGGWRSFGTHLASFAAALAGSAPEVSFLQQHPLWMPLPLSPLLEAVRGSAETLLELFTVALLERPLLLLSSSVSRLLPTAAALVHTLSPLSYSGTFIPFLPADLHPEPGTLVNSSPTPFIIGVEQTPHMVHCHTVHLPLGALLI